MNKQIKKVLGIFSLILISSCSSGNQGQVCTLIGCSNGLTVNLKGTVPASYKLAVKSNGQEIASKECNETTQCGTSISFDNIENTAITLELTPSGAAAKSQDFTVEYKDLKPNGESCPPVCKRGTVEFTIN